MYTVCQKRQHSQPVFLEIPKQRNACIEAQFVTKDSTADPPSLRFQSKQTHVSEHSLSKKDIQSRFLEIPGKTNDLLRNQEDLEQALGSLFDYLCLHPRVFLNMPKIFNSNKKKIGHQSKKFVNDISKRQPLLFICVRYH